MPSSKHYLQILEDQPFFLRGTCERTEILIILNLFFFSFLMNTFNSESVGGKNESCNVVPQRFN